MSTLLTIRQLAVLAGVSRTTVSLALRNHPSIPESTRNRILTLAKEHGYTPDPLVSTLMNQLRTSRKKRDVEKLAYFTFWNTPDGWRENINEFAYYTGACERAAQLGYEIEHFWAKEPGISSARMSRILYTRGIRGVVFGPLPRHLGHVSLDWRYFACAALGLTIVRPLLHRASHSYHDGMMLTLRTLRRMGYKRIGFANSALFDQRVKHGWLSGFLTFQHQLPAAQCVPPLLVPEWNFGRHMTRPFASSPDIGLHALGSALAWNPDKFVKWVEQFRPDVVVSNTCHPLVFLREMGVRVPEEIGFASLHRLLDTDPIAGIDRLPRMIGSAAVDLVVAQLQNNEFGLPERAKTVVIEGVWRDGPTVIAGHA
ncbi:MAG: LacI family DNA-binding transcriptional regulator [Chthoniobacteraceae bacterium]|nr:LacI family DNA-binding transcriptional regulator [Chthoniobacteraceae bacterium]